MIRRLVLTTALLITGLARCYAQTDSQDPLLPGGLDSTQNQNQSQCPDGYTTVNPDGSQGCAAQNLPSSQGNTNSQTPARPRMTSGPQEDSSVNSLQRSRVPRKPLP